MDIQYRPMSSAVGADFGVKQKIFFLYNAIHKQLTRYSQVIHSGAVPDASRAEFFVTMTAVLRVGPAISQRASLSFRPGR
jgi:hypothetical protein